jgi:hypothetical protein
MGALIYSMSVSLDGFVETPDRSLDWVQVDEELHSFFNEEAREMSAFLYGRRLYEVMADYWPNAEDDPNATPSMLEFARIWKPGQRSCSRTPSSASTGIAGWFATTRWRRSLDSRPSRDST